MDNKDTLKWYPLYTKSRHEKKAYENLLNAGYEAFLPLKKSVRQWSDRKKIVDVPLINSYVFVRCNRNELRDVLKLYGIARYISFGGRPAFVRDEEIEMLKRAITQETGIEARDGMIEEGTYVKICSGPFEGFSGKVQKRSGTKKLIIEIEALNKSFLISLDKYTRIKK